MLPRTLFCTLFVICANREVRYRSVFFSPGIVVVTADGNVFSVNPVKPGPKKEMLLKQEGELSPEQAKAKQCADWFMEVEGWFDSLSGSANLRSNLNAVFDALFWGKQGDGLGARPKYTAATKTFLSGGFQQGGSTLKDEQKGLFARVNDRKANPEGFTPKEYYDYLMYGAPDDNEWPGFIHWFRQVLVGPGNQSDTITSAFHVPHILGTPPPLSRKKFAWSSSLTLSEDWGGSHNLLPWSS